MNNTELAWAAGFFDGEGTICVSSFTRVLRKSGKLRKYSKPLLTVTQQDIRPLIRFINAIGIGHINGPYFTNRNSKYYAVHVANEVRVRSVMDKLFPFLSEPKREQYGRTMKKMKKYYNRKLLKRGPNGKN